MAGQPWLTRKKDLTFICRFSKKVIRPWKSCSIKREDDEINYLDEYHRKLVTPEEAVKVVKSGDWVDYGHLCAQTITLDKALAQRKGELKDVNLFSMLTLYPPEVIKADPTGESFVWNSWHLSGLDRKMAGAGVPVYYCPMRYWELPRYISEHVERLDVSFRQVGPMDNHGYFNFGPQNSHSKAVCDRAAKVIVEVNSNQPRCLGGYYEAVHISEIDYIVETDNPPLPELPLAPITEIDQQVAGHIVSEIRDGSCIQLGIGSLASAVGKMIAASDLKNLGCHTEMLGDAYVDMYEAGKLTGTEKNIDPGKLVYSFALGSNRLYEFIHDNPVCAIFPVDYSNNPAIAALNDNLVSINSAIEVDIYGQVCSESFGTRHISGTGGQLDFVIAGYDSRGGKSFVCLPSSVKDANGQIRSRIVPTLAPGAVITDPRTVAHIIVTEYGKADLKGKTVWQRAESLINIAHPDFRDELIKDAQKKNIWRKYNKIS